MLTPFFTIPIYRTSEKQYYIQRDAYVESQTSSVNIQNLFEAFPEEKSRIIGRHQDTYGAWDYNEVVGFVELKFCGSEIIGELWHIPSRVVRKGFKKKYEWQSYKAAGVRVSFSRKGTSSDILTSIQQYIKKLKIEYNNRFIDDRQFQLLAPYIDWSAVAEMYT